MAVYERMDEAVKAAAEADYILAVRYDGKELAYITTSEPHRLHGPELVIMQGPKVLP